MLRTTVLLDGTPEHAREPVRLRVPEKVRTEDAKGAPTGAPDALSLPRLLGRSPSRALHAAQPGRGGVKRLALATVTGVAEERRVLRTPTFGRLVIPDAHDEAVRTGALLIDADDT
jgi:hypothetical protein